MIYKFILKICEKIKLFIFLQPPKEVTISEQSTSHEPSRESQALHVPEAAVALEEEHQKCSGNQVCIYVLALCFF